jgi:hypothetical protein
MGEAVVETLWDRDGKSAYQTRVKCGPFRIHIFWRGDRDPDAHDHPADFWTFPLVSYVEEIRHPQVPFVVRRRIVRAFRPHRRQAEFAHRVLGAWSGAKTDGLDWSMIRYGSPVVTLGWWGKKRRDWGFHTAEGWVPWKQYVNEPGWNRTPS